MGCRVELEAAWKAKATWKASVGLLSTSKRSWSWRASAASCCSRIDGATPASLAQAAVPMLYVPPLRFQPS